MTLNNKRTKTKAHYIVDLTVTFKQFFSFDLFSFHIQEKYK